MFGSSLGLTASEPPPRWVSASGTVAAFCAGKRRTLPLNGAGTCGAALADLGLPAELLRGFALLARTAGLIGHVAEEMRRPIGMDIYQTVEHNVAYLPPAPEA